MANVLKSGSVIKSGSRIKSVDYNKDTTLTEDLLLNDIPVYRSVYNFSQIESAIKFCTTSVAPIYDASVSYNFEDFVIKSGFLYQCINQNGATGDWDATKWEQQKVFDNNGYVIVNCGSSIKIV